MQSFEASVDVDLLRADQRHVGQTPRASRCRGIPEWMSGVAVIKMLMTSSFVSALRA